MKSVLIHFLVDVGYNYSSSYIFNLSCAATCRIYVLFMTSIIILLNAFHSISIYRYTYMNNLPISALWRKIECFFYNDKTCLYRTHLKSQIKLKTCIHLLILLFFLGRQRSRTSWSQQRFQRRKYAREFITITLSSN